VPPGFQGQLSEGLPNGPGRHYDERDAMLTDGWGAIGEWFALTPYAEVLTDCGDVLAGRNFYVGTAKPTEKQVRAAFAHFWRFDGTRFTGVIQVTDTGTWQDGLVVD
jgi:hypothetical protein